MEKFIQYIINKPIAEVRIWQEEQNPVQVKKQPTANDFWIACPDEEDVKDALKGIGGGILAAGSVIPNPLQPVAAGTATALTAVGAGERAIGGLVDDEDAKEGLKIMGEVHRDMGIIGGIPNVINNVGSGLDKAAEEVARNAS